MDHEVADKFEPRLLSGPERTVKRKPSDPDFLFWRRFAEAKTAKAFCQSWLPLQCLMLKGVKHAMVLMGKPDQGPYTPVAVWPDAKLSMGHLAGVAEQAIRDRRGLLIYGDDGKSDSQVPAGNTCVAYPIEVMEKIHGVVVLEIEQGFRKEVQTIMRKLHWGAAWLEVLIRRTESQKSEALNNRLKNVLELLVCGVEHDDFQTSAMTFVTQLSTMFECDRVSIGFIKRNRVNVSVMSHSADFGRNSNLTRAISLAMDEAVDQQAIINHPFLTNDAPFFAQAHEALERQYGAGTILTIPLGDEEQKIGALILERSAEKPFDSETVDVCETAAGLIAPIFDIKRRQDRWLITKGAEAVSIQLKRLLGPNFMVRKLVLLSLIVLTAFFYLFETDYRITAKSIIEGEIKRVIAAPFDGYVKNAPIRAGDEVKKEQIICFLDDRDMKLERVKWETERQQLTQQYHEAMAKHDRSKIQTTRAKIDQTAANIDLLDEQLARTVLTAPFDAVVMSGDLSQSLGAPVERGQVLFEVAPLDRFRVIIEIDEQDITDIDINQKGEIIFSSIPGEAFPFWVEKITPVTTAKEGHNFYRVEGRIERVTNKLRPGMEGIGKIRVEQRRLIWIWTHKAVDWLRLKLWQWMP